MSDCCASSAIVDKPAASAVRPSHALRLGVAFPDWSAVTSPVVGNALLAMLQSDHVFSRWSGYTPAADSVRTALLRHYAETGQAPALNVLAARTQLNEALIESLLAELCQRDLVVMEDGRIVGAYPFTDRDAGYLVELNGQTLNAMCAVDALGIGAMCGNDVTIASRCRHCGAPIQIATQDRGQALAQAAPANAVVWLSIRYEGGCAASSLCTATAFFCSDDHLAEWRQKHQSDAPGFRLSIEEALEAGRALFGPSLVDATDDPVLADWRARTNGRNGGSYDLAIIGAGSAGFSAAITAAEQGAQVALIGHGTIGGTCTNIGCVPSKTLIRAAEALHNARIAGRFAGITAQGAVTDWAATIHQKNALVAELRQAKYIDLLPAYNGIHYREGAARLEGGGVQVDGASIAAGKIIVVTGARPAVPAIPGIEAVPYLTSTTALDLETLPRSLLIIGGGYIGAELAQMFARAGVKVTVVCRSRLLPEAEPEIGAALTGYFAGEGVAVVSGIAYRAIRKSDSGIVLTVTRDGRDTVLTAEKVLVATGRAPNAEGLGLAEQGVAIAANGAIIIDDRMRTTRSRIYAAGDVTGRDQFVYMAAYGAKLAAKNALNGDGFRYDDGAMPAVVFTDPQVASVGLTEAAARAAGHKVRVAKIGLNHVPRALAARDTRGLIKLVAEAESGKLLGAHILAPEGADSIQTAALAIKHGMTAQELGATIFPYLTTVEGLKLAAQAFDKDVAKLSCCAG